MPAILNSQTFPVLVFQKFYGTPGEDTPRRILITPAKQVLIAGGIADKFGSRDGWIACLDQSGKMLWEKQMGGMGFDEIRDIHLDETQTEIMFAGVTGTALKHQEAGDARFYADYWFGRLSLDGRLLWTKNYGGSRPDQANCVLPGPYKGAILSGSAWSKDGQVQDTTFLLNNQWVVFTNAQGEIIQNVSIGGNGHDQGTTGCLYKKESIILGGITTSTEFDDSKAKHYGDIWLTRMDLKGKVLWHKVVKEGFEDMIYRVIESRYGTILCVGSSFTLTKSKEFWFLKLDEDGNVLLNKKFGGKGYEELTSIIECKSGGFLMTGYSLYQQLENSNIKGQKDFWLIRIDANGTLLWEKTFGGPDNEAAFDLVEGEQGEFFVLGEKQNTFETPPKDMDFWLLKVRELKCADLKPLFTTNASNTGDPPGSNIKFLNKTKYGNTWHWDFGDGSTSTERSPVKGYIRPGTYSPKLTVIMENCRETYIYPASIIIKD